MVVRMRHTRAHTGNRRSHHALTAPAISNGADGLAHRHRVSPVTGKYKGVQVIDMTKGESKKEAKATKKIAAKSESKKAEKTK